MKERQSQLDSVRALSLAAVVFQHTMRPPGRVYGQIGAAGLIVFFVLSGFLITGILLEARERAEEQRVGKAGVLGRFYIRRFLRIFPLYYAVLAAAVLLHEPTTRAHLAELATYRTNFLLARLGQNIPPITPLWSLAVEEHFYLVWPLIALFAPRRAVWVSAGLMVVGSVAARGWAAAHHLSYQAITMPTYASVDGIALGCLLALLFRDTAPETRSRWIRRALAAGVVLSLVYVLVALSSLPGRRVFQGTMHMLPVGLISFWAIDLAVEGRLPRLFDNRAFSSLGLVSYGTYVFHRYVMHYLGFDAVRGWQVFASVFAVSVLLATLSWLCFERPINSLKRFWPYVPKRAVLAPAVAAPADGASPIATMVPAPIPVSGASQVS